MEWMLFGKVSCFARIFFFFKALPSDRLLLSENTLRRDQSALSPTHFSQCLQPLFLLSSTPLGSDALYTERGQLALKPGIKPGQILASE